MPLRSLEGLSAETVDLLKRLFARPETAMTVYLNSHMGGVVHTKDGRILSANDAFCQMVGWSHKELNAMGYTGIVPEEYHNYILNVVLGEQFEKRGVSVPYEFPIRTKSGQIIFVRSHTYMTMTPGVLVSTEVDLTDVKTLETMLLNGEVVQRQKPLPAELSAREREVAMLILGGSSSKEIAEFLKLSPKTVENHRNAIRRKLDLSPADGQLKTALQMYDFS